MTQRESARLARRLELAPEQSGGLADVWRLRVVWLACLFLILLAGLCVLGRGLWEPDELRFAEIVQRMHGFGDLFVLRLWGRVYFEKPPLFFWLVRAAATLTGGVRLPALLVPVVLSACLGVWLTSRIATHWYGNRTGMLAALLLASLPLFLMMTLIGRMDMLLAVSITAAVYSLYQGYVEDDRWARVASFGWMAIGLLSKGPFGVLFPLAIAVVALAWTGKLRRLACRETAWGVLVLVSALATWLVPAVLIEGVDYFSVLVGRQVLERAVSGLDHARPPYFYFGVLPVILIPWVLFLPSGLRNVWDRWRAERQDREAWLLCWVVVPFVILSLVREKLPIYLLPLLPPIAIVIARQWSEIFRNPARIRVLGHLVVGQFIVVGVIGAVGIAAGLLVRDVPSDPDAIDFGGLLRIRSTGEILSQLLQSHILIIAGIALLGLGLVGWFCQRIRGGRCLDWKFGALAAVAPCGALLFTCVLGPAIDQTQSWRNVADALNTAREPGDVLATFQMRPYVGFYLNESMGWFQQPEPLAEWVDKNGSVRCLAECKELLRLQGYFQVEYDPGDSLPSSKGPVCVVRLRPLATAARIAQPTDVKRD